MNILTEILSSKVRAEIFCLLFGTINKELHMREIERRSGCAIGTIQTELKKLLRLDLVKKRKDGNRLYYRANKEHPLYPDIRSLVLKTIGLVDILKDVLRQDSDISIAFVFGSIARHDETTESDVDLMVIGKLGLRKLTGMLSGLPEKIGREINPHVLSVNEFIKRKAKREHFVTKVLEAPKIFIMGNENELESMGK
jgi:predicted nucleotidyltransferase